MTTEPKAKLERCPRCNGRMMADNEGDCTCFSCGFHKYAVEPLPLTSLKRERKPSHGGHSL